MGLEKIYQLTASGHYQLRFEVRLRGLGPTDQWFSDVYDNFNLDSEVNKYAIHVSGYSGDNGDVMNIPGRNHNGMKFTTNDQDNDFSPTRNCAASSNGGWWYNNCWDINLNSIWQGTNTYFSAMYYLYSKNNWFFIDECRMMMKAL